MLVALSFAMIGSFMILVMTRRLTALVALVVLPIVFGVLAGHGLDLGSMALKGIVTIAPTATLLLFAVLYFSVMIDVGLFEPLVARVLAFSGDDPVRVALGTAIVAIIVSLDGDGATTALITLTAFLPVYRRLGMNVLVLATILISANTVLNLAPWGGPLGRVASVLGVDPAAIFVPLLPTIGAGLAATLLIAWHLGRMERRRLSSAGDDGIIAGSRRAFEAAAQQSTAPVPAQPRYFWFNLALTITTVGCAVVHVLPLPVLFIAALAIALGVNYPSQAQQRDRVAAHAANALQIVVLVMAAGVFSGVLEGTGMIGALARTLLLALPDSVGSWLGPVTSVLAVPLTFILSNDAFYFGIVPVIAKAAAENGVAAETIGRAALLAQPVHALSPLVAALYLVSGMLDVEVGTLQRYALGWSLLLTAVLIGTAILTGAII